MFNAVKHPDPAYLCTWGSLVRSYEERPLSKAREITDFPQQFGLLPWRTVRDNVGLGLELILEPRSRRLLRGLAWY